MKVLWQVNIVMPDAAKAIGLPQNNFGGWLVGAANMLKQEDVKLTIVTVSSLTKLTKHVHVDGIEYYVLPSGCDYRKEIWDIIQIVQPELIHVHGTEYDFNTQLIHICKEQGLRSVVSLQGIMFACAEHYMDGIPEKYNKINPLLILMQKIYYADSMAKEKERFRRRGVLEKEALRAATHVIGRTTWDKETVLAANPKLKYYHVNENLRPEFYTGETWNYKNCQKHMIFVSQATYPIKGLHMLLPVLPALIKKYPDLQLYIGGPAPNSLHNKALDRIVDYFFEYQKYIKVLIRENHLEERVHYTGLLTAQQMKAQYLKCNVFLSCSSIENSHNSVGEAMILGVPIVASNVGGTESMLKDGKDGILYDFFDMELMINAISTIFDRLDLAETFSENAKRHAKITHDCEKNKNALYDVYRAIAGTSG